MNIHISTQSCPKKKETHSMSTQNVIYEIWLKINYKNCKLPLKWLTLLFENSTLDDGELLIGVEESCVDLRKISRVEKETTELRSLAASFFLF